MLLKKQNRELREKLKTLNNRLTSVFEGMKLEQTTKTFDKQMSMQAMENEIRNADSQIAFYKKEIGFLRKRLQDGDQKIQIDNLQRETEELKATEDQLADRLAFLKNEHKVLISKGKRLELSGSHSSKISAMLEKRKTFTIKQVKLENENTRLQGGIEAQEQFTEKMNSRYKDACSKLGEKPALELSFNPDQLAHVKVDPKSINIKRQVKSAVFSHQIKQREIGFSETMMLDDPDYYALPKTDEEFNRLKHKVLFIHQSARVEYKKNNIYKRAGKAKTTDFETKFTAYGNLILQKSSVLINLKMNTRR